ncbi:helix-turn-helix domain-containing protein [Flavobacterium sp. NRK F7]|uniref:winged helix-turn-helix transcriptional regulator n=1 Tax=Flavobacterium sp. NRK F7 TaxID=2954930 RepID=UPI002091A18B|nr:helix-turn-helix domain-containing protein [Flavobacterium sp. NRK F7]MCO6163672.1 helix-turn-helix transcriptional regulator [Flavobacterium sp. NRK F7]
MPDFIKDKRLFHNPVEFAMNKIGGTYKMPILWRLKDKKWRFNELQKSLSHASDRMLSKSLKELVEDGFITKEIFPEVPPRVEYAITERGIKSIAIIDALRNYGLDLMNDFGIEKE